MHHERQVLVTAPPPAFYTAPFELLLSGTHALHHHHPGLCHAFVTAAAARLAKQSQSEPDPTWAAFLRGRAGAMRGHADAALARARPAPALAALGVPAFGPSARAPFLERNAQRGAPPGRAVAKVQRRTGAGGTAPVAAAAVHAREQSRQPGAVEALGALHNAPLVSGFTRAFRAAPPLPRVMDLLVSAPEVRPAAPAPAAPAAATAATGPAAPPVVAADPAYPPNDDEPA